MTTILFHFLRLLLLASAGLAATTSPLAARGAAPSPEGLQPPALQEPAPEQEMIDARVLGAIGSLGQGSTDDLLQKIETLLATGGFTGSEQQPLLAARYRILRVAGRLDEARATLGMISLSGDDNWKAWARDQRRELVQRTGTQDPEIPERLRDLIQRTVSFGSGSDQAERQLVAVGAPATPAILAAIDQLDVDDAERLIRVLARIADDQAVRWFEARLRQNDDAVMTGLIANNLRSMPVSARNRIARIALDSDNRTVRWSGLQAFEGPPDERVFEVAGEFLRESPRTSLSSSLELLSKLDPTDERTQRWFAESLRSSESDAYGRASGVDGSLQRFLERLPETDDDTFIVYCRIGLEQEDQQVKNFALQALQGRDPKRDAELFRSVFEQLTPGTREWLLEYVTRWIRNANTLDDSGAQLIDEILEKPSRSVQVWSCLDLATKQQHRDAVAAAIDRYAFESSPTQATQGLPRMLEDAKSLGWTDLVPNLIQALDSPYAQRWGIEHALGVLAPRAFLQWQLERGGAIERALLSSATREDLTAMVDLIQGPELDFGGTQYLINRVLELAVADDIEILAPLAKLRQSDLNRLGIGNDWADWLDRNLRPEHLPLLLAQAPVGDQIVYRIRKLVRPEDREQLARALVLQTESTSESRDLELEQMATALLRLGGSDELLLDLASREVAVLRALDRSDLDRRPVWKAWFERGLNEAAWRAAIRDPQVSSDSELTRLALDQSDRSWMSSRSFIAFIARIEGSTGIDFCRGLLQPIETGQVLDTYETEAAKVALRALGQFRDKELLPVLAKALDARTQNGRGDPLSRVVVPELVRTFSLEAVPYLIEAMKSDDPETAEAAEAGLDRLEKVLEEEEKWELKRRGRPPVDDDGK